MPGWGRLCIEYADLEACHISIHKLVARALLASISGPRGHTNSLTWMVLPGTTGLEVPVPGSHDEPYPIMFVEVST